MAVTTIMASSGAIVAKMNQEHFQWPRINHNNHKTKRTSYESNLTDEQPRGLNLGCENEVRSAGHHMYVVSGEYQVPHHLSRPKEKEEVKQNGGSDK